jgi:hypothetical protein
VPHDAADNNAIDEHVEIGVVPNLTDGRCRMNGNRRARPKQQRLSPV